MKATVLCMFSSEQKEDLYRNLCFATDERNKVKESELAVSREGERKRQHCDYREGRGRRATDQKRRVILSMTLESREADAQS